MPTTVRSPVLLAAVIAMGISIWCTPARAQGPAADAGKLILRLRLAEGQSRKLVMTVEQTIQQTMEDKQVEMTQTIGTGYTFDVLKVQPDGTATARVTYHSALIKQTGPAGAIEYDSSNPPEKVHLMVKPMAAMLGQSFTMDIAPTGQVTKIDGLEQLLAHVMKQYEMPSDAIRRMTEEKLRQQFGEEAMKEAMGQMMAMYPDKPVGIGDSWTRRITLNRGFPMILESTWTLVDRADGVAVVKARSWISPNPDARAMDMGMMKMRYELSGAEAGETRINESDGWNLSATVKRRMSGMIKVLGIPGASPPAAWPVTIKSTITVKSSP